MVCDLIKLLNDSAVTRKCLRSALVSDTVKASSFPSVIKFFTDRVLMSSISAASPMVNMAKSLFIINCLYLLLISSNLPLWFNAFKRNIKLICRNITNVMYKVIYKVIHYLSFTYIYKLLLQSCCKASSLLRGISPHTMFKGD